MGRISGRAEKPLQLMVLLYSFNKESITVVHFSFYGIKCSCSLSKPQVSQQCYDPFSPLAGGWSQNWVSLSCDWAHDQRAVSSPVSYVNRMGNLRRKGQNLAYEKKKLEFVTIRKLKTAAAAAAEAQPYLLPISKEPSIAPAFSEKLPVIDGITKWFKTGQCEVSEWETFEHSALNWSNPSFQGAGIYVKEEVERL